MMSLFSQSMKTLRTLAAIAPLALLASACQWVVGDYDDETADSGAAQYINITISVSASNDSPVTRANPAGGEYGDGAESAIADRETKVENITIIFYQDDQTPDQGINTTSETAKVTCVKTYDVHPSTTDDYPFAHNHKSGEPSDVRAGEVLYTTGEKALKDTKLQSGQKYHMLVVANADISVSEGDLIKDVREKMLTKLYDGTGKGIDAKEFVMASEADATVELKNPYVYSSLTEPEKNRFVYYFDCIHMERLAARIDFSTDYKAENAVYDATKQGYVYKVWKTTDTTTPTSNDRFVLTCITPFNLTNGANEYLLKRVHSGANFAARTGVPTYLGDENTASWVLDPYSNAAKTNAAYADRFMAGNTLDGLKTSTAAASSARAITLNSSWHEGTGNFITTDGHDNIIVGYATENTIDDNTPLYYYATGLAISGYYVRGAEQTPVVVYTFLRHQGEGYPTGTTAYDAFKLEGDDATETDALITAAKAMRCKTGTAMNYGVVRNNIYRVSIGKIREDAKMDINIKVKMWDPFTHEVIYM